jgi:SAM-dependent methyltransferase
MDEAAIYNRHLDVFLVWACRETGVIDELIEGPKRSAEVAAGAGITDRAAEIVLEALVDLDYAARTGEAYEAADRLAVFDSDTDPLDRGILPHRVDSLENYMQLPEIMRTGETPDHTREGFLNYVGAMATIEDATVREIVTVTEHAHSRPERILDVGGGPGRFSAEFTRRGGDVTLFDQAEVLDLLESRHDSLGVDVVGGDATESLPTGYDLVFSARMTTSFTPADLRDYFGNAFEALNPGGTFVCAERVRGHSAVDDRFAVHMLTLAETGNTHTESEYRSALGDVGFADVTFVDVPRTEFQAIIGHRPA